MQLNLLSLHVLLVNWLVTDGTDLFKTFDLFILTLQLVLNVLI